MSRAARRPKAQRFDHAPRIVTYVLPGMPALTPHFKIVGHLIFRDNVSPIFTPRERNLLLIIGGTERPPRRHCWALHELSRRVALVDTPTDRRHFDA